QSARSSAAAAGVIRHGEGDDPAERPTGKGLPLGALRGTNGAGIVTVPAMRWRAPEGGGARGRRTPIAVAVGHPAGRR
ncbi:MAG TPA: hypothetical protein VFG12_01730, partial [Rhodopila sp.]|nr:hypothetical protein [Rhodopila sp.]